MRFWKGRKKPLTSAQIWSEEDRQKQVRCARLIEQIANRHLDQDHLGGPHYNTKSHVLISYEDLLNIWDLAGRLKEDL